MRQVAAILLLLGMLPVLLSGFSVECSGVGCGASVCCIAAQEEAADVLLCQEAEQVEGRSPFCHRHERIPLLGDAGERRAGALALCAVPLALPGRGVEFPASFCTVALRVAVPFGAVGEKRPMWVPLRC